MRKHVFLLLIGISLLLPFLSVQAAGPERIESFTSDITLSPDSSYVVEETIVYNFGVLSRHGMYRDIPVSYRRPEGNFRVRLQILEVKNKFATPYPYETSSEGDSLRIKIGDPDTTVSGEQTYVIRYRIERGINFFGATDELYWNVTGNKWDIPIEQAKAVIHIPDRSMTASLQKACFLGREGDNDDSSCLFVPISAGFEVSAKRPLGAGEGLTFVLGLPKGFLVQPPWYQHLWWTIQDNWIVFIPVLVFLFLFWRWRTTGRDPETHKHIAPMYGPPDQLSPAEVGVVYDETADMTDISAALIHLAVRGYIRIVQQGKEEKKSDYQFIRLKAADQSLTSFEKSLLAAIFSGSINDVKLSELKNKFYKHLAALKNDLYDTLTGNDYFPKNPDKVRSTYIVWGVLVLIAAFVVGGIVGGLGIAALAVTGILICIFAPLMPRKTRKGAEAFIHILGLRLYLNRAEKKQIDFLNAPEKNPELFEKLLPYAMVLGVETAWANEFKDIYTTPPEWFSTGTANNFSTGFLLGALHDFSTASNASFVSTPASSSAGSGGSGFSGGFSGGGFGGGGGGSW